MKLNKLGRIMGGYKRVKLLKLKDEATPWLCAIKYESPLGYGSDWLTATPACVAGEGEIDGVTLTQDEFAWVIHWIERYGI